MILRTELEEETMDFRTESNEEDASSLSSSSSSSCPSTVCAMSLTEMGEPRLPPRYIVPLSQRPNLISCPLSQSCTTALPVVDLSSVTVFDDVRSACLEVGLFQVMNHGIHPWVMKGAIDSATGFFDLPTKEKMRLSSEDVREPVRYGTSLKNCKDTVHYWRDFLKHYSHPISKWIHLWPSSPPDYKEKMGDYAKAAEQLQRKLVALILETLGLKPDYLKDETEGGLQVFAVNCYPACPEPDLALGIPPHSDYGSITILLQNGPGLQLLNREGDWLPVPFIEGALVVQLGDQMEVLSNGRYKSVVHRATVKSDRKRISIASLHSLGMDKKVRPAAELVDEDHPVSYEPFSFSDFLEYISSQNPIARFIDTLKRSKAV